MAPIDPTSPAATDEEDEPVGILCPNCAYSNAPEVDFCARCQAPLSMMATIDPLRSTLAEGFVYRRAVDGTSKPIVLVGIWLLFFPTMALSLHKAIFEDPHTVLELGGVILTSLVAAAILYRTTASFLRKRREDREAPPEE